MPRTLLPSAKPGDAGERTLLFLAALHDEAGGDQAGQHREESEDHRGTGGIVADIVRRAQLQESAQIVGHLPRPVEKADEAAVFGSEHRPDRRKRRRAASV